MDGLRPGIQGGRRDNKEATDSNQVHRGQANSEGQNGKQTRFLLFQEERQGRAHCVGCSVKQKIF